MSTTTTLFNLKKTTTLGFCAAMRCTAATHDTVSGEPWGKPEDVEIDLCAKHIAAALSFFDGNPGYKGPTKDEDEEEGTAIVVSPPPVEGVALPPTWLERAYAVVTQIQDSQAEAAEALEVAEMLPIEDQSDLDTISEFLRDVKTMRNSMETHEKEITSPLTAVVKRIRDVLAPAKKTWSDVEGTLRGKLTQAALNEAERNQKLMNEAAKAGDREVLSQMTTSSDLRGVSVKVIWRAVVADLSLLPDEYVVRLPDVAKLKLYVSSFDGAEPKPIPGVRFERDAATRVQSNKL